MTATMKTMKHENTIETAAAQQYFLIEDRRPSGCEFADESLYGPASAAASAANSLRALITAPCSVARPSSRLSA